MPPRSDPTSCVFLSLHPVRNAIPARAEAMAARRGMTAFGAFSGFFTCQTLQAARSRKYDSGPEQCSRRTSAARTHESLPETRASVERNGIVRIVPQRAHLRAIGEQKVERAFGFDAALLEY